MRSTTQYALLTVIIISFSTTMAAAQEPRFKRGDRVVVVVESADLKLGKEVAAKLTKGQRLTVTEVRNQWVGCTFQVGDEKKDGWIDAKLLAPAPAKPVVVKEQTKEETGKSANGRGTPEKTKTGETAPVVAATPKSKAPDKDEYNPETEYFSSAEGKFRIKFPERPKSDGRTVSCNWKSHQFTVEYFDRTAPEFRDKKPDTILDNLQATLEKKWGKFEVEKPIKIITADRWLSYVPKSGNDMITIGGGGSTFTYGQGTNIALYLTPQRVYVVTVSSRPYSVGEKSTMSLHLTFLHSFEKLE